MSSKKTKVADKRLADREWRLSHLYKIRDKEKKLVTFKPNNVQRDFEKKKHSRNIILKSRQLGFTTLEAIDMLDETLFTRNFEGLLIAQDLDTSKDIFDNKVKLAWKNFPLKHLYDPDLDSARRLKVEFGDDTFSSITVDNTGRAGTFNRLHITEFDKLARDFPDRAREVLEGSIPAVPTSGRVDIESTAQQSEGPFYDLFWDAWDRGDPKHATQFKAHFYNWRWDPEIEETEPIDDLPKRFLNYQKEHQLSDKEISYYYLKFVALGEHERNWETMRKEYPTTPEEAFAGAGKKLFDTEVLGRMETKAPEETYNNFRIWKGYRLGHRYGIGCDVSEGVGESSSTIVVWDFSPARPEVVAEYANAHIEPDLFAYEIRNIAEKYERPIVAVESNNKGHTTTTKLREIYPERLLYQHKKDRFGWRTDLVSKPKMLYDLNTAVNESLVRIPSERIVSEMRRYDEDDLRVVRARDETTKHWDLLMATAIGFQMKDFAKETRPPKRPETAAVSRGKGIRGV